MTNVRMATVTDEEEKEDEVTRYLGTIHDRLTVLLMRAENFGSRQDRSAYIIKQLIADRTHTSSG